ncbi:Reverse transcriptase domain-containing protein [Aphis craccivora]|uniref:Reverse transcriptase domain-containing protein n=1 Tax=Aphis craccivora TaxID=307492 RepID=A0A6G0WN76_APHCR|nr:Reverse transcriptase domain-containing protein [Aphis craccivora]
MGSKFLNGLLDVSVDSLTLLSLINFKVTQHYPLLYYISCPFLFHQLLVK